MSLSKAKVENLFRVEGKDMQSRRIAVAQLFLYLKTNPNEIKYFMQYPVWDTKKPKQEWAYSRLHAIFALIYGIGDEDTDQISIFVNRAANAAYSYLDDNGEPHIYKTAWQQYWSHTWAGNGGIAITNLYNMLIHQKLAPAAVTETPAAAAAEQAPAAEHSSPVPIKVEPNNAEIRSDAAIEPENDKSKGTETDFDAMYDDNLSEPEAAAPVTNNLEPVHKQQQEQRPLRSGNIEVLHYHPELKLLWLRWPNGTVCILDDVDPATVDHFKFNDLNPATQGETTDTLFEMNMKSEYFEVDLTPKLSDSEEAKRKAQLNDVWGVLVQCLLDPSKYVRGMNNADEIDIDWKAVATALDYASADEAHRAAQQGLKVLDHCLPSNEPLVKQMTAAINRKRKRSE